MGELEIGKRIASIVGYENLLVKVHPRDNPERFRSQGFHVAADSGLPWEAIQLCNDFSDKVFITVLSGSVIGLNTILEHPIKVFVLFPLVNIERNELAKVLSTYLLELMDNPNCDLRKFIIVTDNLSLMRGDL